MLDIEGENSACTFIRSRNTYSGLEEVTFSAVRGCKKKGRGEGNGVFKPRESVSPSIGEESSAEWYPLQSSRGTTLPEGKNVSWDCHRP